MSSVEWELLKQHLKDYLYLGSKDKEVTTFSAGLRFSCLVLSCLVWSFPFVLSLLSCLVSLVLSCLVLSGLFSSRLLIERF